MMHAEPKWALQYYVEDDARKLVLKRGRFEDDVALFVEGTNYVSVLGESVHFGLLAGCCCFLVWPLVWLLWTVLPYLMPVLFVLLMVSTCAACWFGIHDPIKTRRRLKRVVEV